MRTLRASAGVLLLAAAAVRADGAEPCDPRWSAVPGADLPVWGVAAAAGRLFAAAGDGGLLAFDVADPAAPRPLTPFTADGEDFWHVAAAGNRLFTVGAAQAAGHLRVLDPASDPPTELASTPVTFGAGEGSGGLRAAGEIAAFLHLGDWGSALRLHSTTAELLASFSVSREARFELLPLVLFVSDRGETAAWHLSDPRVPQQLFVRPETGALAAAGDLLAIVGEARLVVYDGVQGSFPRRLADAGIPFGAVRSARLHGELLVVTTAADVVLVSLRQPFEPAVLSRSLLAEGIDSVLVEERLFVATPERLVSADVSGCSAVSACDLETSRFIPVAAKAAGFDGARYETELLLSNPLPEASSVSLEWTPRGGGPPHTGTVALPARGAASVPDVVGALRGEGAGALRICAYAPVGIAARTRRVGGCGGVGAIDPAHGYADAIGSGENAHVFALDETPTRWTNLGFVNVSEVPVEVTVEAVSSGGEPIGMFVVSLAPREVLQRNRFLAELTGADVTNARARLTPNGGRVFAYASRVDADSGDFDTTLAIRGY